MILDLAAWGLGGVSLVSLVLGRWVGIYFSNGPFDFGLIVLVGERVSARERSSKIRAKCR